MTGHKILTASVRNDILESGDYSKAFLEELQTRNAAIAYYNADEFGTVAGYYDTSAGAMPSENSRITNYDQISTVNNNNTTNYQKTPANGSINLNKTAGL